VRKTAITTFQPGMGYPLKATLRKHCSGPCICLAMLLFPGCASSPREDLPGRAQIDAAHEQTIAQLLEQEPELEQALEEAAGYMFGEMRGAKIPFVGSGSGAGVIIDNRDQSRTYVEISEFEVGGGFGLRHNRFVMIFDDVKLLRRALSGRWHYRAGVQAEAQEQAEGRATRLSGRGYRAYRISEGAVIMSVTVRAARVKPLAR
jgi:hypothetical protein